MTKTTTSPRSSTGAWLIFGGAALLAVLHQDSWLWDDRTLVFGFLPVGLAYHATFSLAAAALWATAIKIMWPHRLEEWADTPDDESTRKNAAHGNSGGER